MIPFFMEKEKEKGKDDVGRREDSEDLNLHGSFHTLYNESYVINRKKLYTF